MLIASSYEKYTSHFKSYFERKLSNINHFTNNTLDKHKMNQRKIYCHHLTIFHPQQHYHAKPLDIYNSQILTIFPDHQSRMSHASIGLCPSNKHVPRLITFSLCCIDVGWLDYFYKVSHLSSTFAAIFVTL